MKKIALIGLGKLGSHLSHYLNLKKIEHIAFKRDSNFDELKKFHTVLLCIPDDQLVDFYTEHHRPELTWIHFSGALYHEEMIGLHPMMSFSSELFDLAFYEKLSWTIDHDISLKEYLPISLGELRFIEASQKPYYHALCVMAGNIPQLVCEQAEKELLRLGLSEKAIKNYIKTAFDNYLYDRPATGPIVRRDSKTIASNLSHLPIHSQQVYQAVKDNFNENYQ